MILRYQNYFSVQFNSVDNDRLLFSITVNAIAPFVLNKSIFNETLKCLSIQNKLWGGWRRLVCFPIMKSILCNVLKCTSNFINVKLIKRQVK